jgi:hypothetical protein
LSGPVARRPPPYTRRVIEILRFALVEGADEVAFLEADKLVQVEFAYQQPGLLRRTTARADDGTWVVVDLWQSAEQAEACNERWGADAVTAAFMSFVAEGSVTVERYQEIG